MKSVIEQASTIIKALEKGWEKAGKPREFSIKILETPKKNFLGLTIKPAKIGIFFSEKVEQLDKVEPADTTKISKPERPRLEERKQKDVRRQPERKNHREPEGVVPSQTERKPEKPTILEVKKVLRDTAPWSDDMIKTAQEWLIQTMNKAGKQKIPFVLSADKFYLKCLFDKPIFDDPEKERQLFRSLAHLLVQALKNTYKRQLRGYKVILQSSK